MFSSRTAWFDHEHRLHRVQWLCPFCSNTLVTSLQSFYRHIQKDHARSFKEDQLEALASISKRPLEEFQCSACPLCLTWETNLQKLGKRTVTPTQFRRHLGGHMEQLALFAIPREDHLDEGDSSLSEGSGEDEVGQSPVIQAPGGPPGGPPGVPTNFPPIPPTHHTDTESSGSSVYTTASGRQRHRHHLQDEAAAGMAGAALGTAAADTTRRRHGDRNTDSLESPPISLKVMMHNDGRHVTLRRLTEEEAIAQREARRKESQASSGRRRRNSSIGSSSGGDLGGRATSADRRWRRTEALEATQATALGQTAPGLDPAAGPSTQYPPPLPHDPYPVPSQVVDPQTGQPVNLPPPPPIPGSTSGLGGAAPSITPPGSETSGATDYANQRRRRRAERAQARLARGAGSDGGGAGSDGAGGGAGSDGAAAGDDGAGGGAGGDGAAGSITPPGSETSGATDYANQRRRRRAERAQARLAREGRTGGGNTVEFT
jgi:hypothetical protein